MKVLNLYSGIGGNRKLWGGDITVTAVEWDKEIAKVYQEFYPNDTVIVADAHKYLIEHMNEYDFIWASPPCPSHSKLRTSHINDGIMYPDMTLYQEIIVLKHFFKGKEFVVENVIPYYRPLIAPSFELDRHFFWCGNQFIMKCFNSKGGDVSRDTKEELAKAYDIDLNVITKYKVDARHVLRNCVDPQVGKFIFDNIMGIKE
jgi:DNA (cytosine-5)-methyltransferase 1